MIRLPHTLSKLIGLPTKIYQTIYDGALAFLVVVAPPREAPKMSTKLLSLHGEGRAFSNHLENHLLLSFRPSVFPSLLTITRGRSSLELSTRRQLLGSGDREHVPYCEDYAVRAISQISPAAHTARLCYPERHVVTALYTASGCPARPHTVVGLLIEDVVGAAHTDVDHTAGR